MTDAELDKLIEQIDDCIDSSRDPTGGYPIPGCEFDRDKAHDILAAAFADKDADIERLTRRCNMWVEAVDGWIAKYNAWQQDKANKDAIIQDACDNEDRIEQAIRHAWPDAPRSSSQVTYSPYDLAAMLAEAFTEKDAELTDVTAQLHTTVAMLNAERERVERLEAALQQIAVDPPVSETPTIESILNQAQSIARQALATHQEPDDE